MSCSGCGVDPCACGTRRYTGPLTTDRGLRDVIARASRAGVEGVALGVRAGWEQGVDACIAELEKSRAWTLGPEVRAYADGAIATFRAMRELGPSATPDPGRVS